MSYWILAFPWLAQNGVDVFTREGCLGKRKGNKITSITDCPEVNTWGGEDTPSIDTRPIHECGALRRRPKRRQPKCPAWLDRWADGQVALIEAPTDASPLGWHSGTPPPGILPLPSDAALICVLEKRREFIEQESDAMLEVCLLAHDDIPKQPFEVCGDDDDDFEYLSALENWDMAKKWSNQNSENGNVSGIYVSTEGKVESNLAKQLRQKLLEEYADTVFRPQIYRDPPERVLGGIHTIKLKENAQPVYQQPFQMAGEDARQWKKSLTNGSMPVKLSDQRNLKDGEPPFSRSPIKMVNGGAFLITEA